MDNIIWLLLFLLLLLGVPIWVSLGMATVTFLFMTGTPLSIIPIDISKVSDLYPLLAIPSFVFAGCIMEQGGIAKQIVEVAHLIVGKVKGGLAIVTIIGCMFFAAMIGSGPGTVAAMGSIMIPAMVRQGYGKIYASGVSATGGTLGILIPPSNPLIIYGVMANVSVSSLFLAGFFPGLVGGIMLIMVALVVAKKRNLPVVEKTYTVQDAMRIIRKNFFSLLTPFIILGGIYGGIFTPVEASSVAVVYALLVGKFINKTLTWEGVKKSLTLTSVTSGTSHIIIGVSILFGRFLTINQIPQNFAATMLAVSTNPIIVLLLIVLLLYFLGMFMETLSTIVILVPILMPVIHQLGIDPIYFGILWIVTNQVALISPPLGANLFIAMNLSNTSLEETAFGTLPFLVGLVIFTLLILFVPSISLFLPQLFSN